MIYSYIIRDCYLNGQFRRSNIVKIFWSRLENEKDELKKLEKEKEEILRLENEKAE
jgi:hypothetical protein